MACRDDDYRFLPIVDAISSINQNVNLVGVVLETSIPRQFKGTDCFCTVKIIDESYSSPGLLVNCFGENMERLPSVHSAGDIILFSRVMIKSHCGDVNAVFNKKISSFAIFEGKHGTQFLPYQASANFHPRDEDNKFLDCLRKWLLNRNPDESISLFGLNEYLPLEDIRVGEHLTLICKVLHICKVQENKWMAFVWDGTDAPRANMRAKKENEIENLPPLQLEPTPLPRDVLLKFPTIGTILRVVMEDDNQGLQLLNCDRWVKLVNVKCEQYAGLWRCMLMPSSKLQYLSDTEKLISESQRNYEKRLTLKRRREPFSGHLPPPSSMMTETSYTEMPFVTLMDVITHPKVNGKFKCAVRVIAIRPFQSEDFCSPQGIYRITLTLEDATARIHAFLFAEDSEYFFDGYPSDRTLKRTRNALLGVMIPSGRSNEEQQCAQRNPPWVQLCLKSYYTDKNDKWGSRKYRIFATRVVD
ncbi:protection of telomeres protein 1a-like [Impatiens glandulifera]|uniref:protection of telomeres protein 1a-like n=1 Tax=Impatiens glandulifera TaxID=253017 RepID=UPI001FB1168D|nr:protection of telomeres protein 1a-like [Impatiens glandulifera]